MKAARYSVRQILANLKQAEVGSIVPDLYVGLVGLVLLRLHH